MDAATPTPINPIEGSELAELMCPLLRWARAEGFYMNQGIN